MRREDYRAYVSWLSMRQRCLNPKHEAYGRYAGRGITICERWLNSFENFLEDMGERPADTSIDRINNDGNYEPGNCRWATIEQQCGNRRNGAKHNLPTLVGKRFGRLSVVERVGFHKGCRAWKCLCDCGNYKTTVSAALTHGKTRSCGCYKTTDFYCRNGHERTVENTEIVAPGHRSCRICTAATRQRRYARDRLGAL